MKCRTCGEKMIEIDKSKDPRYIEMKKGLDKMGIPMSFILYVHPKDKGCALRVRNRLHHFTAKHPKTLMVYDMYFKTLKEAKRYNRGLVEWKEVL